MAAACQVFCHVFCQFVYKQMPARQPQRWIPAGQPECVPSSQDACRAARILVGQPEYLQGSQYAGRATRMLAGQPEHVQGGENACRAARMHSWRSRCLLARQPECLPAGQPECVPGSLPGSQNACRTARLLAGQPERLQGGQNACQALPVACQWPGSGLAVAWQPGSGWSGEVGGTFEVPGR